MWNVSRCVVISSSGCISRQCSSSLPCLVQISLLDPEKNSNLLQLTRGVCYQGQSLNIQWWMWDLNKSGKREPKDNVSWIFDSTLCFTLGHNSVPSEFGTGVASLKEEFTQRGIKTLIPIIAPKFPIKSYPQPKSLLQYFRYRSQQKSFCLSQYESEFSMSCNWRSILFIQKTILQTLGNYPANLASTSHN